jgi:hypothetical protein
MAKIQKIGRVTFIREHDIKVLNVAGSRGSTEPGVAAFVKQALEEAFYPRAEGESTQQCTQFVRAALLSDSSLIAIP